MKCPNCSQSLDKVGVDSFICKECKEGFILKDKKMSLVGEKGKAGFIENVTSGLKTLTDRCKTVLEESGFIPEGSNDEDADNDWF